MYTCGNLSITQLITRPQMHALSCVPATSTTHTIIAGVLQTPVRLYQMRLPSNGITRIPDQTIVDSLKGQCWCRPIHSLHSPLRQASIHSVWHFQSKSRRGNVID